MIKGRITITPGGSNRTIQIKDPNQSNTGKVSLKSEPTNLKDGDKLPPLTFPWKNEQPTGIPASYLNAGYICSSSPTTHTQTCTGTVTTGKADLANALFNNWSWDSSKGAYYNSTTGESKTGSEMFKEIYGYASPNQGNCPLGQYNSKGNECNNRPGNEDPGRYGNIGNNAYNYSCRANICFPDLYKGPKEKKDTKEPGMNENPSGNEVPQMN